MTGSCYFKTTVEFCDFDASIRESKHLVVCVTCLARMRLEWIVKFELHAPAGDVQTIKLWFIKGGDESNVVAFGT